MSYTLGPLAITTTKPLIVPVGTSTTVGAVVVGNESPYAVSAQAGGSSVWALAQMANRLNCDSSAFSGNVTLTADSYLSNENEAPSFVVFLEVYAPGEPIPGSYPCSLTRMSNVGNPSSSGGAANVIEQDLLTPFVLSGLAATKDGSVANQLDVTAGVALMRQADQSLGRITPSSTTFETAVHSTTYFLDLQTDGSWSWNTSHSTQPNYLTIAQVTTDGSGNISTVTDERTLNTSLLAAMAGAMNLPRWASDGGQIFDDGAGGLSVSKLNVTGGPSGSSASIDYESSVVVLRVGETGATAQGFVFQTWNGSAGGNPFGIGAGSSAFAGTWMGDAGNIAQVSGQATAGSFGVPVIVAQALNTHVTATTNTVIIGFTPAAAGFYRVSASLLVNNGTSGQLVHLACTYWDANGPTGGGFSFVAGTNANTPSTMNGVNSFVNGPYSLQPQTMYATGAAGHLIQVAYQDPGGTPNDFVSIIIERLS